MVGTNVVYIWFVPADCLSNFSCFKNYAMRLSYATSVHILNNTGVYSNQEETGTLYMCETWSLFQGKNIVSGCLKVKLSGNYLSLREEFREVEKCTTKNFTICNIQQILS